MSEAASEIVSSSAAAVAVSVSSFDAEPASNSAFAAEPAANSAFAAEPAANSAFAAEPASSSAAAAASASNSDSASAPALPLLSNSNVIIHCRCEVCGTSGILANFYSPRFCSRECRYERNKGNHVLPRPDIGIITCRECGKTGSSTEFFSAKYCSKKCRYERGGRPPAHRANAAAPSDVAAAPDARLKPDTSNQRPPSSHHSDLNVVLAPVAAAPRSAHALGLRQHANAASTVFDSTTNQFAANWQMLVDYQPRDKEHALPYLLDAIAALQDTIVQVSLECVQAEVLLTATSRRLQQLEDDASACVTGAADADSVEDRKAYYDVVRKLWVDKALLQKDETRMLEQLRKQMETRAKLRAQLLEKQQALLTLGLTLSRRSCRCPVAGCPCAFIDSIAVLRSHLDKAHGLSLQDIVDSQGWNAFIADILRKHPSFAQPSALSSVRASAKPAMKGPQSVFTSAPAESTYLLHISDLLARIKTEGLAPAL